MRSPIKAFATAATVIALATTLSACSLVPSLAHTPTPTPTLQSVSEACAALESEVKEVRKELSQAGDLLNTHTAAAAEILKVSAFRLEYMAGTLENEQVIELATEASGSITRLSDVIATIAEDPANADTEALTAAGDDVNAAINEIATVCAG